jgi:hypothetical protein
LARAGRGVAVHPNVPESINRISQCRWDFSSNRTRTFLLGLGAIGLAENPARRIKRRARPVTASA